MIKDARLAAAACLPKVEAGSLLCFLEGEGGDGGGRINLGVREVVVGVNSCRLLTSEHESKCMDVNV
jgi:hypothetical protein